MFGLFVCLRLHQYNRPGHTEVTSTSEHSPLATSHTRQVRPPSPLSPPPAKNELTYRRSQKLTFAEHCYLLLATRHGSWDQRNFATKRQFCGHARIYNKRTAGRVRFSLSLRLPKGGASSRLRSDRSALSDPDCTVRYISIMLQWTLTDTPNFLTS